ncbi:hypothetical protein CC1G_07333 [Coprinopsis cinerea okayama7|uniref:F-box domain-containing protein n=1 Tax=Coprinopsis cinerea (strain Okayama-7 / 130 / ATCC MYA-4618 / FGSC 9003) TaxID=240176 RepID=A8NNS5_COPC7|nr:hypothetical protein CC1G_07333 [Coprinopsis cinerea okayama7\|eukprot:XP_001835191.2 hypothetical protein CC1G_07333 [Coprinopsis cinerea okayama7\
MVTPSEDVSSSPTTLDTRHITSYLALSKRYPLDILIDARDYEWDFLEDGVTQASDVECYSPPFSSSHMKTVFDLLLPHLSRWKTLSILTDTWKPMHTALQSINTPLLHHGAPLLESLTLMRCNDFVSFSSDFQPASLREPAFLSNAKAPSLNQSQSILPRLKHLSLRGVHMDWASLGAVLASSVSGLSSLELSSHCPDVRPSASDFHRILSSSPRLRKLIVSGSGPFIPGDTTIDALIRRHELDTVPLPDLTSLNLGYRSSTEGQLVLQLIHAPCVTSLTLEEATHPAEPDEIDAGGILTYLGTGEFQSAKERDLANYDSLQGGSHHHYHQYHSKPRKDSTSSIASTSTCVGSSVEIDGRLYDDDHDDDMTLVDFDTKLQPPFPLLEALALKSVWAASSRPVAAFLGSLNRLKRLELVDMPMYAVHALISEPVHDAKGSLELPSPSTSSSSTSLPAPFPVPCSQLETLSLRNIDLQLQDLHHILNDVIPERHGRGGDKLQNIDIHLSPGAPVSSCQIQLDDGSVSTIEDAIQSQGSVSFKKVGVLVNLTLPSISSYEGEEEDLEMAFNDPHFDSHYDSVLYGI